MALTLVDESTLVILALLAVSGWGITTITLLYILAYIGREPFNLAHTLAMAKRNRLPVALVRLGREIRYSPARALTGSYWLFRIAGNNALAYVRPESVYRLANTNVFIVSVSSSAAFTPQDLENIKRLGSPEATERLRAFLSAIVPERLESYASQVEDAETAKRILEIKRQLVEKTGSARSLDELYGIVNWLREQGVDVKAIAPVETALDIDAADAIAQRQGLDPQSLMFAAAGMTQVLQEAMAKYLKPQKTSGKLLLILVLLMAAAATLLVFMAR